MAEVSFNTLEALGRRPQPSETGASIVSGYARYVTVNGPLKTEWNYYQQAAGDTFAAVDTFVTGLVHPIMVEVNPVNMDQNGGDNIPSASLEGVESSATFRTVTVRDADAMTNAGILVKVHGF